VLPSPDGTASDHAGPETLVNVGSSRESFAPIGSNLPGYDNYFCRDCPAASDRPESGPHEILNASD
jgi:hypothetical protein